MIQWYVPLLPLLLRHANAHTPYATRAQGHDALVFSCNHHFPRRRFFDTVLPKFETLVRSFPVPIPSTIALIVDDYHHKLISQVCPVCLYRTLKREQETLAKGLDKKVVQLQSWEL